MLEYLIEKDILFREGPLYKVNINDSTKLGISWSAIRRGKLTEETQQFLSQFLKWRRSRS